MAETNTTRSTRALPQETPQNQATPSNPTQPTRSTRNLPAIAPQPPTQPEIKRHPMIPSLRSLAGRPRAFTCELTLRDAIDDYFASCFTEKMVVHPAPDGGDPIVEHVTYQFAPFTLSGLAIYLQLTTKTLREYSKDDQFGAIVLGARLFIENYCEKQLFEGKNASVVWNLMQCNYGYRMPKTELALEATGKDGAPLLDPERNNSKARQTRAAMLASLAPAVYSTTCAPPAPTEAEPTIPSFEEVMEMTE